MAWLEIRWVRALCLFLLGLSSPVLGDPAVAPGSNRQVAYNAAQAALDRSDWAAAIAGFTPLLPTDAARPFRGSEAVIAARLAYALSQANRGAEADAMARRAIAALPENDPVSLQTAWQVIADDARYRIDYPAAIEAYGHAMSFADASGDAELRVVAVAGYAQAAATIEPIKVAAAIDALLGDAKLMAAAPIESIAMLDGFRARAAINDGDKAGAELWIGRAVQRSGGLTATKVNLAQVSIRGDAAIIARLRGDDDETHKYLTWTGAGHLKSIDWIARYEGDLPVCGIDGDLRPEDSAVVQFTLGDDGRVLGAMPVYASRPGEVGTIFAKAIATWHWNPDLVKPVDGFWRATMRLDLRCETRPKPTSLSNPFWQEMGQWLRSRGVVWNDDDDDAASPYVRPPIRVCNNRISLQFRHCFAVFLIARRPIQSW